MNNKIEEIIKKGKNDDSNLKDRQEMLALFHQPELEFQVKEKLLEELEKAKDDKSGKTDLNNIFSRLWQKIEMARFNEKRKQNILLNYFKVAAILVIGIISGFFISNLKTSSGKAEYYAARSPKGSISEMILPDSTIIFLNADSRIKYSISSENGEREVYLNGEAWFDVAKNKKKPFVVHTNSYDVFVTGTKFNVKSYDEESEVITTLEEGSVLIQSTDEYKLAEDLVLKPGEQIVLNKETNSARINVVNTKWYTSWKDNKLIFVNMTLKDLVVLLERKYGVDIEVNRKDLLDLHFDGTIKNESIIEILEIIKKTLPVDYKIEGQKVKITGSKKST